MLKESLEIEIAKVGSFIKVNLASVGILKNYLFILLSLCIYPLESLFMENTLREEGTLRIPSFQYLLK